MLVAGPAARPADLPAAALVTGYTSTPFNEFLLADAGETGDSEDAGETGDSEDAGETGDSEDAAPAAFAASPAFAAPPAAASGRPLSQTLTVALGVAVFTAAGVTGGLTLLHQRTGQQAQAGPSLGRAPTAPAFVSPTAPASVLPTAPASVLPTAPASAAATAPAPAGAASALPTSSPTLALAVVPARRAASASMGQWAGWIRRRDQYQEPPAAEHGRQPQQFGEPWPGRAGWQRDRWGVPPDRGGPDGGAQHWQRDGGHQR